MSVPVCLLEDSSLSSVLPSFLLLLLCRERKLGSFTYLFTIPNCFCDVKFCCSLQGGDACHLIHYDFCLLNCANRETPSSQLEGLCATETSGNDLADFFVKGSNEGIHLHLMSLRVSQQRRKLEKRCFSIPSHCVSAVSRII